LRCTDMSCELCPGDGAHIHIHTLASGVCDQCVTGCWLNLVLLQWHTHKRTETEQSLQ